jgi:hypothetical protein
VRRPLLVGAAALVLLGAVSCAGSDPTTEVPDVNDPEGPLATAPDGAPAFPLPADPGAQIRAAGLRELDEDAEVTTAEAHVDVIINGYTVPIPAGIGTTPSSRSPVSTPADDGVVRIDTESTEGDDEPPTFTLGQLFTQWGVRLDKSCVATYCTDDTQQLLGIVNGQLVGDPASIAFADQHQIVVWFGPRGSNPPVPVSYDFPPTSKG